MKITLRSNGSIQIFLEPETAIERAFVDSFVERSVKGGQPKIEALSSAPESGMVLSMREGM